MFSLVFADGTTFDEIISGSYRTQYGGPNGVTWSVNIADKRRLRESIAVGSVATLKYSNRPLVTGYAEQLNFGDGTITISGRDLLATIVDSSVNPFFRINEKMKLRDALNGILKDFGFTKIELDNVANLEIQTGKSGKGKDAAVIDVDLTKIKSDGTESVNEMIKRLLSRQGYYLTCAADGQSIIVSKPDYYSDVLYDFVADDGIGSNILSAEYNIKAADCPSVIVSLGRSSAGDKSQSSRLGAYAVLEFTEELALPAINAYLANPDFKGLPKLPNADFSAYNLNFGNLPFKPVIIRDDTSKNQTELELFLRRKKAEIMFEIFSGTITIQGLMNNKINVVPNTLCNLKDSYNRVNGVFWIDSVESKFDRSGIITKINLTIPGII
jgi:prophage tail gpP-like protein